MTQASLYRSLTISLLGMNGMASQDRGPSLAFAKGWDAVGTRGQNSAFESLGTDGLFTGTFRSLVRNDKWPHSLTVEANLPQGESMDKVSEYFLGLAFRDNALGEGPHAYDADPLFRVDAFDCTTFVETVWALSFSQPPLDWTKALQRIRYRDGRIAFVDRLHFISRDWMPYHIARGALEDITGSFGLSLGESTTRIDRRAWYQKLHGAELKAFDADAPQEKPQTVTIHFLSFSALLNSPEALVKLKSELKANALLVNFVRPDWDTVRFIGTRIDVSHQALILLKGDGIVMRHASAAKGRVVEEDFLEYARFYRHHPSLKGLQLVRIRHL